MSPFSHKINFAREKMSPFLYPPPDNAPIVIYEDGGGLVDDYIRQAHIYSSEGRRIEIRGSCRSACLLALSVPGVCVTPSAQVKAHHAYEKYSGVVREDITNKMLAELPRNIRDRLEGRIQKTYNQGATLDYKELIDLNVADCKDKKQSAPVRPMKIKIANPLARIFQIFTGDKK